MDLSDSEGSDGDDYRKDLRAKYLLNEEERIQQIKEWLWNDYGNNYDDTQRQRVFEEPRPKGVEIAPDMNGFIPVTVFGDVPHHENQKSICIGNFGILPPQYGNIVAQMIKDNSARPFCPLSPELLSSSPEKTILEKIVDDDQEDSDEKDESIKEPLQWLQSDPIRKKAHKKASQMVRPFIPMSPVLVDNVLGACKMQKSSPGRNPNQIMALQKGIHLRNVSCRISATTPSKLFDTKGKISVQMLNTLMTSIKNQNKLLQQQQQQQQQQQTSQHHYYSSTRQLRNHPIERKSEKRRMPSPSSDVKQMSLSLFSNKKQKRN